MSPKPFSIQRILIVYKRSVYQKYIMEQENQKMSELLRRRDVTTKTLIDAHKRHNHTLEMVVNTLSRRGVNYDTETRHKLKNLDDYDMIFSVGGDGTFLRTSHYVKNQLLMGINSSTKYSVGALCSVTHHDFEKKLDDILAGRFRVKKISRMRVLLNDQMLPIFATNDVLFTNSSPAATSRYFIQLGRVREEHKSSGVWIATPVGSTAALHAAGGTTQRHDDRRLQFMTREPFQGIYSPYQLTHGFVQQGQRLTIRSKMVESMVYIDGPMDFFTLHYGDRIGFELASRSLHVIV
jgi:NAD+ kinase